MIQAPATATPQAREELHFRRIDMHAYRRPDGLYEAEAVLVDRKPFDLAIPESKTVPAGEAVHDMTVTLVFDAEMTVHEVRSSTRAGPFGECMAGGEALQSLKGLKIAGGWSRAVRERLRRPEVCTHLAELLIPLGTTATKALTLTKLSSPDPLDDNGRPKKIDSCYAYRADGAVVMKRWPAFHAGGGKKATTG